MKIPNGWIEHQVRWEDPKAEVCGERGGEGMFPHLYNGLKLGKDEVESVTCWELPSEGHGWGKQWKTRKRRGGWFIEMVVQAVYVAGRRYAIFLGSWRELTCHRF